MAKRMGFEAVLNYKVGGQGAGGSWIEDANVRDLTLSMEKGEADFTTRGNAGWKALVGALKSGSVEWEMVWDTADAGFVAIRNAWFGDAMIGLQILDAPGGQGLQADFEVFTFSRAEPLEAGQMVSVGVKVTYSATPPSWIGA